MNLTTMREMAVDLARARPRGLRPEQPQPPSTRSVFWPGWSSADDVWVTADQLLGLPAANRAVSMVANAVASMTPPRVFEADEITPVPDSYPVVFRPNATYGAFDFWSMATTHLLTSGNLVAVYADFDSFGLPRQVVPVPTSLVNGYYDDGGFPAYEIGGKTYRQDDLIHVRALSVPGQVMGVGPVTALRRAFAAQLNQSSYAANTYASGAVPSGIITLDEADPSQEQAQDVQDQWVSAHGAGSRKPAVLPQGWTFTPLAWSPEDAQFIEAQQFSAAQCAWVFGLSPSDLEASAGGSGALTYQNLTTRQAARLTESYGPWLRRLEDGWSDAIAGGRVVRFDRTRYLHASRADLINELKAAKDAGFITVDEARQELRLPPLTAAQEADLAPPVQLVPDTGQEAA